MLFSCGLRHAGNHTGRIANTLVGDRLRLYIPLLRRETGWKYPDIGRGQALTL